MRPEVRSGRGLSCLSIVSVVFVVVIITFIVVGKRCLYSFCFLIKILYLLNTTFDHLLCCCNFVSQNSQLDRLLESLKILTSSQLVEVTVVGVI